MADPAGDDSVALAKQPFAASGERNAYARKPIWAAHSDDGSADHASEPVSAAASDSDSAHARNAIPSSNDDRISTQ
jgi:hypothetical protein